MPYAHFVKPGSKVDLAKFDASNTAGIEKDAALEQTKALGKRLGELQELMFAAGKNGMLVVFQGRDTAGKDGAINRLLEFVNVQSCRVSGFKVPTPKELAHDFLWRVHSETPGRGAISVFNRSHYEDVLVVRVHSLVPEAAWRPRYNHINAFEKLLTDSGIIVVKFCLLISKDEQEQRLLEREQDPTKAWKLSVGDWKEREYWDDYTKAYDEALEQCSNPAAPWYIVPANKKWFRDLAVMETLVSALEPYEKPWMEHLEKIGAEAKAELEAYRSGA